MESMKRTHRTLLVMNYAVSFQDHDEVTYMEWSLLKKYLSRKELIQLIHNFKKPKYDEVTGQLNWVLSGLDNGQVRQVIAI